MVVRVVNASGHPCRIHSGQLIGDAAPAVAPKPANRFEPIGSYLSEPVGSGLNRHVSATPVEVDAGCENLLKVVIDSLPDDLSDEQRRVAVAFIRDHDAVFWAEFDLGCTNLIPHRIETGNKKPFRQPLRRHRSYINNILLKQWKNCCVTTLLNPLRHPGPVTEPFDLQPPVASRPVKY